MRTALLCAVLASVAACGPEPASAPKKAATFNISGSIAVPPKWQDVARGDECVADDGYDDIREGTQVLVTSGRGSVIAKGNLDAGVMADECAFSFWIEDVPERHEFYSVEVSHRGKLTYSRAEAGRQLELSLGD